MPRRNARADVERVSHVLAGMTYPAAKWQLIMHAEEYGTDAETRPQLWALAPGSYPSLAGVLGALGFVDGLRPLLPGHASRPMVQAQRRPVR